MIHQISSYFFSINGVSLFVCFPTILRYRKQGNIQPITPGMASRIHKMICGGCAVTANVEPTINAVPITPRSSAYMMAADVFDFSNTSISLTHASKFLCSLGSSVLLIILRFRFKRSITLF